jgi:uncharacterized protein (DUF305 family)
MTHITSWRAGIVAFAAIIMLAASPLAYSQAGGQPAGQSHQHGASCSAGGPTVTTCSAGNGAGTESDMSGMDTGMSSGMADDTHPMMGMERFDLIFIDTMITHHESAIAMAEMMLQNGTDPDLIVLAQDIVDTQPGEVARMQEWRDRWYPNAPAFVMTADTGEMMQSIDGLDEMARLQMMGMMDTSTLPGELMTAPEEVDLAFANAMIVHHQGAHMMMEMAVLHSMHPELAGIAGTMLETHHEQIMTMQDWQLN